MRPVATAVGDPRPGAEQCWCCDTMDDALLMVHLGNHPEVALCRPCARWAALQAGEIDDRTRTGPGRRARDLLRAGRRTVVARGWHRRRFVGGLLRRLGRHVP